PGQPGYRLRGLAGSHRPLEDEMPDSALDKDARDVSCIAGIRARLDNYFALPFLEQPVRSLFDVVPEKTSYEFRVGQPLVVRVSLVVYEDKQSGKLFPRLVDSADGKLFWGMKFVGPDSQKRESFSFNHDPLGHLEDDKKTLENAPNDRQLRS